MALTPQQIDQQTGVRYDDFDPDEDFWGFIGLNSPLGRYLLTTQGRDKKFREDISERKRLKAWLQVEDNLKAAQRSSEIHWLTVGGFNPTRSVMAGVGATGVKAWWRVDDFGFSDEAFLSFAEGSPLSLPKDQFDAYTVGGQDEQNYINRAIADAQAAGVKVTNGSTSTGTGTGVGGGGLGNGPDPLHNGGGEIAWHNVPSDGELWEIDGNLALAYQSDIGGPWIYYTIPDDDTAQRIFPDGMPKARRLTQKEADRLGAINPGSTNLLSLDLGKNWEEGFNATIEREALTSPWLKDGEVVAAIMAATLEGRAPTDADLESTEYFASRSDAEIKYIAFAAIADEDELEQYHADYRERARQALIESGVRNPDPTIVDFIARKQASGQWTPEYTAQQVIAIANPFSSIQMDEDLAAATKGVEFDTLRTRTEEVKTLVKQWLGPMHGDSYSEEWYRQWAGSIADDANAKNDLVDYLQGQRLALYPEYENANLRYADIAPVWENTMLREWGVSASNPQQWGVLDRVIRANDSETAGKILREEGLNLGIEQVNRRALEGFGANVGDQVVRSF